MAYQSGTFSSVEDLLNTFAAWSVTQGWTQKLLVDDASKYAGDTHTGRRLHISKTLDGEEVFFNFRSGKNQQCFEASTAEEFTGIFVNGSANYDVARSWDKQPNGTVVSGDSIGGGVLNGLTITTGAYHMFATPTGLSLMLKWVGTDYWRGLSVGGVQGRGMYMGSSDPTRPSDTEDPANGPFRMYPSASGTYGCSVFDGSIWNPQGAFSYSSTSTTRLLSPALVNISTTDLNSYYGSFEAPLLLYSQDDIRGISVLAPCVPNLVNAEITSTIGEMAGVKYTNTRYIEDEQIVSLDTSGTKDYMVFNVTSNRKGIAFLK